MPDPPAEQSPLTFIRRLAGPVFVIGGWQLIPISYWVGVILVYCGFVICMAEVIYEPWLLQKPYQTQVVLIGVVLALVDIFSIFVVLVPAPLRVIYLFTQPEYAAGITISGIPWRPMYSELDVIINNPTADKTYSDLNIVIRPDVSIAVIKQGSNLGDVSFEDYFGVSATYTIEEVGKPVVPMVLLATDAGYRVHCERIPPQSSLKLVMALVDFKPAVIKSSTSLPSDVSIDDIVVDQSMLEKDSNRKFHYFWATMEKEGHYASRPKPKHFSVSGSYVAMNRKRYVKRDISVQW